MRFGCIFPCLKAKLALQIQGLPQISYHVHVEELQTLSLHGCLGCMDLIFTSFSICACLHIVHRVLMFPKRAGFLCFVKAGRICNKTTYRFFTISMVQVA